MHHPPLQVFLRLTLLLAFVWLTLSPGVVKDSANLLTVDSPNGQLSLTFQLENKGQPTFEATYRDIPIATGTLGLEFAGSGVLEMNLKVVGTRRDTRDETYAIPVGKASSARDHHHELVVSLEEQEAPRRKLDIAFRAFDDGFAFRYLIPEQQALSEFVLSDELTRLRFPSDPTAYALPLNGFMSAYEDYYQTMPLSAIDSGMLLGLPLLMEHTVLMDHKGEDGKSIWIAVTEADLTDYAGMYLTGVDGEPGALAAKLSPLPGHEDGAGREDGAKVIGNAPHTSPWRVLLVADDPGRLIESNLIFNLNAPSAIDDPSWIKPGATTLPWWNGYVLEGVDFEPGVNTATMKHYIDFCAEVGIPYHALDGLDIAWYDGPIRPQGPTDVTTAAPSIDMPELLRNAQEKGIRLRLWVHWKALKPQLDEAFAIYEKWGIEGVMIDFMNRDDQEMVNWYHEVAEKAARHHLTVTWHGAYKPTGMERTWPNVLNYEAVLNQEYNKSSTTRGALPEHNLNVAFIRNIAGPLDYHQGGMRSEVPENYQPSRKAPPVQGTRGHQLAMNVVYLNHLPMLADYPAAYRGQPGFEFLTELPANWDETRVLHAEMGRSIVVARRKGDKWYLGGMTADQKQVLDLSLDFLGDGSFEAEFYLDNPAEGPTALTIRNQSVSKDDTLPVKMPPSGGFAARITSKGK